MHTAHLLERIQFDLFLHHQQYKFYIEIAVGAVLFYVGYTDFRTFKIRNNVLLLLLVLYVLLALVDRSLFEVMWNVILAVVMFVVLLWFYTQREIGGGDVKLLTVACLWGGIHCALLFSILLILFIGL